MGLGGLKMRVDGALVTALFKQDGKEFALQDLPYDACLKIAQAFYQAGKEAEEYAKANEIVLDQAILFRSGAPFAITDNPQIREEAKKEAVHNRELRRSNLALVETPPGGIESRESVGRPVVSHAPTPEPRIVIAK